MKSAELETQSFIVKIWTEANSEVSEQPHWQGKITHVITGEEITLEGIEDIEKFMIPYLTELDKEEQAEGFIKAWRNKVRFARNVT